MKILNWKNVLNILFFFGGFSKLFFRKRICELIGYWFLVGFILVNYVFNLRLIESEY